MNLTQKSVEKETEIRYFVLALLIVDSELKLVVRILVVQTLSVQIPFQINH